MDSLFACAVFPVVALLVGDRPSGALGSHLFCKRKVHVHQSGAEPCRTVRVILEEVMVVIASDGIRADGLE